MPLPGVLDFSPFDPQIDGALRPGHVSPVRAAWCAAGSHSRQAARVDRVRIVTSCEEGGAGHVSPVYVRLRLTQEAVFLLTPAQARHEADVLEAEQLADRAWVGALAAELRRAGDACPAGDAPPQQAAA